jgi:vitamin B12 transporter
MVKTNFISLFAVFLFSANIFSQQDIIQKTDTSGFYKLNDVVIIATRTASNTVELANSISLIDSAEIVNKNSFDTFDAIKNEYGISFTQQGGKASVSNIYIRGGSPSESLVIIDGVEVNMPNDPSNFYNFFSLPLDNTSRIEILRGPQSTLYGSDALTGVVNIISLRGQGKPSYNFAFEGGSYNSYKGTITSLGSIGNFNYSAALSRTKSDGYSAASDKYGNTEKDGFQLDNFNTIVGYDFSKSFNADLVVRYNNSSTDLDQSFGSPNFWDDKTYEFDQEEYFIRAQGNLNLMDNKWNQKIGLSYFRNSRNYSFDTSAASVYYYRSNYDGKKYKADWQNDFYLIKNHIITAGIDFKLEEMTSEDYSASYLYEDNYESIFPQKSIYIIGIYIEDQAKIGESFFASLGIRYDYHSQFGLVSDQSLSFAFGSSLTQVPITGRFAPTYIFWETGTKLKASIGTGFKAPSLFNLYSPLYGNSNLKPEQSLGWDAGIEQFFWSSDFSIGANYFYNKFKDMFGYDSNLKTININEAETNGVEVFAKADLVDGLTIKGNYTYLNARDKSENTPDYNQKLIRRPENKAGVYVSYTWNNLANINIDVMYVGKRDELDFATFPATRIVMQDYFLINFAAYYDLFSFLRLQGRGENLLDKQYEEIYGYGTPGFSIYGGINLSVQ